MGDKLTFLDIKDFKQKALEKQDLQGISLRKQFVLEEVKQVDGEDLTLQFTISTGSVDRDQDTLDPEGWKLENYQKNPVVLWAHDYQSLPVARAAAVWVENGKLMSRAQFTSRDLYPFGYMVHQFYREGFLKATSVGFNPVKWGFSEDRKWGIDFIEQELLEYSCVPVPANPEALIAASAKGIDIAPLKEWAEKTLDEINGESGLWLPRAKVERAFMIVDGKKTFLVPGLKAEGELDDQLAGDNPLVPESEGKAHKAGRVLSKANEERIGQARDLLQQVLDQLAEAEPVESEQDAAGSVSHKDGNPQGDELYIELADDEPATEPAFKLDNVEPNQLKEMVQSAVADALRAITGRVD